MGIFGPVSLSNTAIWLIAPVKKTHVCVFGDWFPSRPLVMTSRSKLDHNPYTYSLYSGSEFSH